MTQLLRRLANFQDPKSISYKMRMKRMQILENYIEEKFGSSKIINIIDLGGTEVFWDSIPTTFLSRANITLVNLTQLKTNKPNFTSIAGDACSLPQYPDLHFDLVFSNSVIEHVGSFLDQRKMANEIKRLGRYYFVQTPNKYFPIEPHFLFPFFQFLPENLKVFLVTHWQIGQYPRIPNRVYARKLTQSVRLLRLSELITLFGNEKFIYDPHSTSINQESTKTLVFDLKI